MFKKFSFYYIHLLNQFKKVALITGITGQDGSLLADYLLKKDIDNWSKEDLPLILKE